MSDGTRVYVTGSDNAVNTVRLSDGKRLWTVPLRRHPDSETALWPYYGTAASGGRVYVGTGEGLRVYDAASGRRLWEVPRAPGSPVVAGGRVFVARTGGVTAASATGCGAAACPILWDRELGAPWATPPGTNGDAPFIGGASATMLFASYFHFGDGPEHTGRLVRLSAATGAVTWSTEFVESPGLPSRGGDLVWIILNRSPHGDGRRTIAAYAVFARTPEPLYRYPGPEISGFYGGIAISAGTAVVQRSAGPLMGFRVPGT